jgi:hypothetical protein
LYHVNSTAKAGWSIVIYKTESRSSWRIIIGVVAVTTQTNSGAIPLNSVVDTPFGTVATPPSIDGLGTAVAAGAP